MKPLLDAILKFLVAQMWQAGIDWFLFCISLLHTLIIRPMLMQLYHNMINKHQKLTISDQKTVDFELYMPSTAMYWQPS